MKLFPKDKKYSLGQKIDNDILEILELSVKAAYLSKQEKLPVLKEIDFKINFLKTMIRLANEIKALDNKKYLALEKQILEIGRMNGGWLRSISQQ